MTREVQCLVLQEQGSRLWTWHHQPEKQSGCPGVSFKTSWGCIILKTLKYIAQLHLVPPLVFQLRITLLSVISQTKTIASVKTTEGLMPWSHGPSLRRQSPSNVEQLWPQRTDKIMEPSECEVVKFLITPNPNVLPSTLQKLWQVLLTQVFGSVPIAVLAVRPKKAHFVWFLHTPHS